MQQIFKPFYLLLNWNIYNFKLPLCQTLKKSFIKYCDSTGKIIPLIILDWYTVALREHVSDNFSLY